jgi:putative Holliday junction resolvase
LLRKGRRLAIDVGKARVGLAISDFHAILASPLLTVNRLEEIAFTAQKCLDATTEFGELLEIYVGVPLNLKGLSTESTTDALLFAEEVSKLTTVPVYLIDERMTTSLAQSQLRQIGKSQREARSTIDQMAAVAILEYALNVEKTSGQVPGVAVQEWKGSHE